MFRSDWGDTQLASSTTTTLKAVVLVGGAQKGNPTWNLALSSIIVNKYFLKLKSRFFRMLLASLALISLYAFFLFLPVLLIAYVVSRCPLRLWYTLVRLHSGTRFRPLSLQLPKPLFPIAGVPLIEHHIEQLSKASFSNMVLHGHCSSVRA